MGARAALTLAYGCGIFSYGALAMATNISMLYLSRALAVFLACMQGKLNSQSHSFTPPGIFTWEGLT